MTTIVEMIKNSHWNKKSITCDINLNELEETMENYTVKSFNNSKELLKVITPDFQRDNNKWTLDMQIKFMENLILGCPTTLLLGTTKDYIRKSSYLIDGLQRFTAMIDFKLGKFKIFNKYTFKEVPLSYPASITLKFYKFDNYNEMIKFYISMNENITHSKEDILKAKLLLIK